MTPCGPWGETLVPFESDQDKHRLASLPKNPKAEGPLRWAGKLLMKNISVFSPRGPVLLSLCCSVSAFLSSAVSVSLHLPLFGLFFNSVSLCHCSPLLSLSLPSGGTTLAQPYPLFVPFVAVSTESDCSHRWPSGHPVRLVERRGYCFSLGGPTGVPPRSRQLPQAVTSAKTKALAFTCWLPGPPRCPRGLGSW